MTTKDKLPSPLRVVAMLFAILALSTKACQQVEVLEISNDGVITDYETPEDEIYMFFGVGTYVFYEYQNDFRAGMAVEMPEKAMVLPCFYNEPFYFQVTEIDKRTNETAQAVLDCKNLQLGENKISV